MENFKLRDWCLQQLGLTEVDCRWETVSGDASFRRYYRLSNSTQSWIAADAPPDTENNEAFVDISQRLTDAGVLVPEVLAVDYQQGYLLLKDLGDQLLLPLLTEDAVDDWYGKAMQQIIAMQKVSVQGLPDYDAKRLYDEMNLFRHWFVESLLDYTLNDEENSLIESVFQQLIDTALAQPRVFVHRDYHSRNIMVVNDHLATIDFQDAVVGPMTYDLVSLLRDCYVVWPPADVSKWLQHFYQQAQSQQLLSKTVNFQTFSQWFDEMGLQRHIKVLGIFARLHLRDGKSAYLKDLPLVIYYVLSVASQHEGFATFVDWFQRALQPRIKQQAWSVS